VRNIGYIFLLVFFAFCLSCRQDIPHCNYEIDLPVVIINKADTVFVGDTLFFESKFSSLIPEKNRLDFIELENIDFHSFFSTIDLNPGSSDHSGSQFDANFIQGQLENYFVSGQQSFGGFLIQTSSKMTTISNSNQENAAVSKCKYFIK